MKSKILRDEIIFKIQDYLTANKDYESYKFQESMDGRDVNTSFEDSHNLELKSLQTTVYNLLLELQKNSIVDNFYFFDCPFKVYQFSYHKRLFTYLNKYVDSNIFEFLKEELEIFDNPNTNRILSNELLEVNYNYFGSALKEFDFSLKKKIKFIVKEIESMNYEVTKLPDEEVQIGIDKYEFQPSGYSIVFKRNVKNINEFDSNKDNNFTYDKKKSFEFNLSKLTIFPKVSYETELLKSITVNVQFNQKFIVDISELKAILIDSFFNQIKEVDSAYKVLLAEGYCNNLKLKIEALQNQIELVKENPTKVRGNVLDILTLSLSFNEEMHSTFNKVISIETASNKKNVSSNQEITTSKNNENETFKKVYLEEFCKQLANDRSIQDNAFCHIFKLGILHFVPYLQDEIRENLINLDPTQQSLYIDILKNKIKNTPFYNFQESSINHWLEKYKESKENFPFFNKGKLYKDLNSFAYWHLLKEKEHLYLEELQYDFFCYGSMIEAKKMIDFIDDLINPKEKIKFNKSKSIENSNSFKYKHYTNQLSHLTDFMAALKKHKFIAEETELTSFRKIFSGSEVVKKVLWTGNISQLFYFIKYLHYESDKIDVLKKGPWFVAVNCFEMEEGKVINRERLRKQQKPANLDEIEKIINNL